MATRSGRERGGLRSFRLGDVPESVRFRALDNLLKTDGTKNGILVPSQTLADRLALGIAAERPSERVYWVSAAAWERESRKQTWRRR